jgi:predicted nucleic acid-binding protein
MIYPGTTFLVAYNVSNQPFYPASRDFFEREQEQVWLWSPWHRVEVFNSIRQLVRHPDAKYRLSLAEACAIIRLIEQDVSCEYLQHVEADWRDVLRVANQVSVHHAASLACRSADLLHVAYALELNANTFVSFDRDQLTLAEAAGLKAVRP